MVFTSSEFAFAYSSILNAANNSSPNCAPGAPTTLNYGNQVITASSATITKIDFLVANNKGVSSDSVKIYSNSGNGSAGTLMGTFTYSGITAVSTYYRATFTGSASLLSGTTYWVMYFGSDSTNQLCMETNAATSTSSWYLGTTSGNFQLVDGTSAFSYFMHFDMEMFYTGSLTQTSISFLTLSPNPSKLAVSNLRAQVTAVGTVTFFLKGLPINRCKNLPTDGSNQVSCSWKPNVQGSQLITAVFTPSDPNSYSSSSAIQNFAISKRNTAR